MNQNYHIIPEISIDYVHLSKLSELEKVDKIASNLIMNHSAKIRETIFIRVVIKERHDIAEPNKLVK